jgi:hypothetical protein
MRSGLCGLLFVGFFSQHALAFTKNEFPARGRLFIGSTKITPTEINDAMTADGMGKFDMLNQMGVEISTRLVGPLDFGFRYAKRMQSVEEDPTDLTTEYKGELTQDTLQLIVRTNVLRSKILRADVFAGAGGANSSLKLKTATQDGEIHKKASSSDWYGSLITSFGATVGIGYNWVYFVVEGGLETNKVRDLKSSGATAQNIGEFDLSGGYLTVGLLFDGIKASKR